MACRPACCKPLPTSLEIPNTAGLELIQDDGADQGNYCDNGDLVPDDNGEKSCCDDSPTSRLHNLNSTPVPAREPRFHASVGESANALSRCVDTCCGGSAEEVQPEGGRSCGEKDELIGDDCCVPNSTEKEREKSCSVPKRGNTEKTLTTPDCCEGKTSPCCDVSCLDRIALRECENVNPRVEPRDNESISSCIGNRGGKPCSKHAHKARERYASKLEAIGCICRALLALGQDSCCVPRQGLSGKRTSSQRLTNPVRNERGILYRRTSRCSKTCCAEPEDPSALDTCVDGCCAREEVKKQKETSGKANQAIDPEKGLLGKEHIILSVSGMTCTGCETKLQRTLATIESVKNLKTSLVLARAEFDLDLNLGSLEEVTKHLERATEFKCEKISNQGTNIDVLAPCDSADFINQPWPYGVTEMRVVNEKVVNVVFNANVIGARDLVEKGWDFPIELADPRGDPTLETGSTHVRHVGYITLLSIILTIPVLVMAWAPLPEHKIAYSSSSLALATIVQFAIAGPFYPKALKSLIFSKLIEMDLLIVLSTSAAYIFSVVSFGYLVSGNPLSTGEFFETSTLLVTLIMVGRYVTALARQKAVESISIRSLQTSTAVLVDDTGEEREIDVRLLQYGDIFKVPPDARIPTDGTIISGTSEVDESMITGESRPVDKVTRSPVVAGSINGSGKLVVKLTRLAGENTVNTIAGMVDEAKLSKPKVQDVADRVASYFVPVVLAITIFTFVIWVAVGVGVRKQSGADATVHAITYAITVLIISCPCAIGLAVPMVILIASGVAAERGVIFKSAEGIEIACKVSHVVFDKTGTLTQGKLSVTREVYTEDQPEYTKSILLGLVSGIKHPVSAAVATHLKAHGVSESTVSDQRIITGKGVEGSVQGVTLRAGNSSWVNLSTHPTVQSILADGYTAFCFTVNDSFRAVFALEDTLRPEAAATCNALRERGISVHIVSGDDDGAVRSVATSLNIPDSQSRSRCDPAGKQAYIQTLLSQPTSHRHGTKPKKPIVMFCGDGTNDAVALTQATIGVHMNEGTDVAKFAADVVLMRPSLTGVLTAIAISKKASNRVVFNFAWSFVYNLFAILLAAGAFVDARIPPEFAALGELVSVLPVIVAALLLRFSRF
ncbi:copper-transporting ATPase [Aspergillus sclerotialis]|uniref:Copper-transporting ATPase n=1 Tax=Aspergillus sclerotialis TaxID=2070753 RepID=A0A3A2ZCL3_9EURO|nr:copper-transporting ATPase [Aspergillus sclerotialis]